jgi:ABC-2 type transport system ATP-binding protein
VESLLDNIVILDNKGVALNATTAEICSRLKFGKAEEGDKVIYSERTISGDMAVIYNENEEDSQLNIELLFNAASANRDAIRAIFNK